MGRHDEKVPGSPEIVEALQRLVAAKPALQVLLQELLGQDQRLLAETGG